MEYVAMIAVVGAIINGIAHAIGAYFIVPGYYHGKGTDGYKFLA